MTLARRKILAFGAALTAAGILPFGLTASAKPETGQTAPAFTATDTHGKAVSLADLKGKTVVLEWSNHGCPFVQRHYGAGNMQKLQAEAARDGVIWLTIISSAPGRQGHVSPSEANELSASRKALPAHVILDPEGEIGRLYQARTTPHMFVIDPEGRVAYMGGIDDQPHASRSETEKATNYVRLALNAMKKSETVAITVTRPYGCSVKYGSDARS
jgi:peroxiredoxin